MMEPSILATLARYFNKKLGIANGLSYSGEGFGALLMPILMRVFLDTYAVRGCLLLLGGMWAQSCVVAALMRPPPCGRISRKNKSPSKGSKNDKFDDVKYSKQSEEDDLEMKIVTNSEEKTPNTQESYRYVDLLKNTHLLRIICTLFCGGVSSYGALFVFPALALEWGASNYFSALTVSMAGACEIISKLSVGPLIDSKILHKHTILFLCFMSAGIAGVVAGLSGSAHLLMGYAVILGLTGFNFVCLAGPLLADCVPQQALGSAMGLYLLAYGSGIALGYPLVGK